ncbi:phage antirepressor KilAC domain-containing protein [Rhodococcus sp. USK10]|uniref:BRO family protein n=1 Tax=Rhodococcus sp. USK10 TaxID=2789739 RepID=UPI001C5F4D0E|nr:BRO family protein [Rhodococcus sp. USK10]QYB01437.1 phage antirepressor KilAC domain-containing protein [Rhodococcus sp. USK10]
MTVELFRTGDWRLRTVVLATAEPGFVLADACKILGLSNPTMAARSLDPADLSTAEVSSYSGQRRTVNIVNESGLYELVFQSRKPEAKKFRRWVTAEVLPAIRKTGTYSAQAQIPKSLPEALRAYATEVEAHEATRAELEQAAPAAAAWDALADADGDYSLRDAAQILSRDPAITTGQNRLMVAIRQMRMVDNTGQPYQKNIDHLRLRVTSYEHPHSGEPVLSKQVRITVHGLKYLHKRLGGTQPLRLNTTIDPTPLPPALNRN